MLSIVIRGSFLSLTERKLSLCLGGGFQEGQGLVVSGFQMKRFLSCWLIFYMS